MQVSRTSRQGWAGDGAGLMKGQDETIGMGWWALPVPPIPLGACPAEPAGPTR